MTLGLLLTSFSLGLRHGVDWDHIAAIADLQSTAPNRRRGFFLALLYALGHAAVVFVLGAIAILFGSLLPSGLASWMSRIVGVTLVTLGLWVLVELVRQGRNFRLRSRWMLILSGTFAGFRKVREGRSGRRVVVDHDHDHDHDHVGTSAAHDDRHAHDHAHDHAATATPALDRELVGVGSRSKWWEGPHRMKHTHRHSHELVLPDSPGYGSGSATGIGILHGIGVESPTQIAVFAASSAVGGTGLGLLLLSAWIVGMVAANSILALLAGFGLLHAERNFGVFAAIAVVVAVASIVVGGAMAGGYELLPAIEL